MSEKKVEKKVIVKNNTIIKKKRGCCGCLTTVFVVFLVLLCAGAGVGWYFGDQFTKKNYDMSFGECFGIVGDVYSASNKDIVTNPYTKADLDAFYDNLKAQLFLKPSVQIDADTILNLMNADVEEENTNILQAVFKALGEDLPDGELPPEGEIPTEPEIPTDGTSTNDKIINLISGLFTKENMQMERLAAYEEGKHGEYLLNISDKSIAAFSNDLIIKLMNKNASVMNMLEKIGATDLGKIATVDQMSLYSEKRTLSDETESYEADVSMIKATVSVRLAPIIKGFLSKQGGWWGKNFYWFAQLILPKRIYATVTMGLNHDVGMQVYVNNMDSTDMNKAFKLVKGISGMDVQETLDGMFTDNINPILDQVEGYVDLDTVSGGKLTLDPYQTVVNAAGINAGKEEIDKLTSQDILITMRGLLTSDIQKAITEAAFDHWYYDPLQPDKLPEFKLNPVDITGLSKVDFKEEFKKELESKYLLDLSAYSFEDIMSMFGVGTSENKPELLDLFTPSRLHELYDVDMDLIKINISDRMMGAIIDSILPSLLGENSSLSSFGAKAEQIIMTEELINGKSHNFMNMGISIDPAKLLGENETALTGLLTNLLNGNLMISVKVDITPKSVGFTDVDYIEGSIMLNELSASETDRMLTAIAKIVGKDILSKEAILAEMQPMVRNLINDMSGKLPIKLGSSMITMPSIFDTLSELVLSEDVINEDGTTTKKPIVTGEQLRDVLEDMNAGGHTKTDTAEQDEQNAEYEKALIKNAPKEEDNVAAFEARLKSAYYLNGETFNLDALLSGNMPNTIDNASFDLDSLNGLYFDTRNVNLLAPSLKDRELVNFILTKMAAMYPTTDGGSLFDDMMNIKEITISVKDGVTTISMIIGVEIDNLINDPKYKNILSTNIIYLKSVTYVGDIITDDAEYSHSYARTTLQINDMKQGSENYINTNKILQFFNKGASGANNLYDFEYRAKDIGRLFYEQLEAKRISLENSAYGFRYIEGGLQLPNFYEFLSKTTNVAKPSGLSDEAFYNELKATIQGLQPKTVNAENLNNFVENETVASNALYGGATQTATSDTVKAGDTSILKIAGSFPNLSGSMFMTDNVFGKMLIEQGKLGGVGTLTNLSIVAKADVTDKAAKLREWANTFRLGTMSETSDYMLFTFNSSLSDFGEIVGGGSGILPSSIQLSVILDMTNGNSSIRINNLTKIQQDLLFSLAGLNDVEIVMMSKINECKQVLDSFMGESFTSISDEMYSSAEYDLLRSFSGAVGVLSYTVTI